MLATKTSVRSLTEAANAGPQNLDELYLEAWNRVLNQNPDSRKDAQDALCWVSCSFRQLRVEELRHALATRNGDRSLDEEGLLNFERLVRLCAGLLVVDKESQIVRLVHQTAQIFFEERKDIIFANPHVRLARTCLTYLQFDDSLLPPCDPESLFVDFSTTKVPTKASRLLTQRFEKNRFMAYAVNYWGHHARGRATEKSLRNEILTFLKTPSALPSAVAVEYRDDGFEYMYLHGTSKRTPIHIAVLFELEYILEILLREVLYSALNAKDGAMRTPFHIAAGLGLAGCAQLLLAAGADIRTQDKYGCTPLQSASEQDRASTTKLILEHGSTSEWTMEEIHADILTTQKSAIERYIRAAPKPTERANIILMESSALNNPRTIAIAFSFGADVNIADQKGRTALLLAVRYS